MIYFIIDDLLFILLLMIYCYALQDTKWKSSDEEKENAPYYRAFKQQMRHHELWANAETTATMRQRDNNAENAKKMKIPHQGHLASAQKNAIYTIRVHAITALTAKTNFHLVRESPSISR